MLERYPERRCLLLFRKGRQFATRLAEPFVALKEISVTKNLLSFITLSSKVLKTGLKSGVEEEGHLHQGGNLGNRGP